MVGVQAEFLNLIKLIKLNLNSLNLKRLNCPWKESKLSS